MLQSPETKILPSKLREVLSKQMNEATFTEEPLREGLLPVLLMLRGHAVTAFAIGDEVDYEPLYEAFKKHYMKCSAEWSAKDVSFVFCLPDGVSVREAFCSRVEVDVYFCRKYVIQLERNLRASLARLPFLPLSPVSGAPTRPPSAQTLLSQRSMKAALASALVLPARMSAESILDASLAGKYGPPHKVAGSTADAQGQGAAEERVQTTLKSISIQNFRAYRAKKEFTLGSAVTVLYGPNGFGKTSFFDAIDFAATGGVRRLNKANAGLAEATKHLDSGEEPTMVSLTLERDGKPYSITRTLADPSNAHVDGKSTNRKDVLSLLTGGASSPTDRLDNMVALFRATHLFSQDSQELTQDVAEKCELPADIVSRMLAFEDYVGGLKKTNEVLKLARQRIAQARKRASDARQVGEADAEELARLEGLATAKASPEQLDARFNELEQAITSAGFDMSKIEIRDTRGLRAMLDAASVEEAARKAAATEALGRVGKLKDLKDQFGPLRARLEVRTREAANAEEAANTSAESLSALTSDLAGKKVAEQSAQNTRDWLRWAVSMEPEHARLSAEVQTLTDGLATLTAMRDQQAKIQAATLSAQAAASAQVQRLQGAFTAACESRLRVQDLLNRYAEWQPSVPRHLAVISREGELNRSIESKRLQVGEMQQAVLAQEFLVARIERELSSARSNDSSLKELIAEMRTHVDGVTCVLCGHDHGSEEALLAAIDKRMAHGDLVVRLSESLSVEKGKLQTQIALHQETSAQLRQDEQKLRFAQDERVQLERQWFAIEASLEALGLATTGDVSERLTQKKEQLLAAEQAASQAVTEAKNALAAAKKALEDAQTGLHNLERDRNAAGSALDAAKGQLNDLLTEAHRGSISLELGQGALSHAHQEAETRATQASTAVQASYSALEAWKPVNAAAKANLATARSNQQQATTAWNAYQTAVQQEIAALNASKFGSAVTDEQLRAHLQAAITRQANAVGLRNLVSEIEVAVDTAATSAAFENLRSRIAVSQKLAEEADAVVAQHEPWVKYFDDVAKLLDSQQAFATDHFISEYGSRTAVIQQRLRPVYGFGDIEVSSNGTAIGIRVQRKGVELRPTDYFSQSQVQTLVLGLFLTACSSQTWSGFSSIMMDDPVTHFDDLNTYALLDLVSGLQSSPEGARQFVISTCDEKLLQLSRQKFRHLGPAARFYRFSAIGADGPMVSEIPA
jgi:DNA repair protein SbcC/Rad50